jgi:hypothetical protein
MVGNNGRKMARKDDTQLKVHSVYALETPIKFAMA